MHAQNVAHCDDFVILIRMHFFRAVHDPYEHVCKFMYAYIHDDVLELKLVCIHTNIHIYIYTYIHVVCMNYI